jgi:alkylated DNA repair dioxygenase AlkB
MYTPNFINHADEAFKALREDLNWERRDTAPRSEYWTNIYDQPYTYGHGAGERTYQSQPNHFWIEDIDCDLRYKFTKELHKLYLPYYEGCFLNMYQDGSDALGWHADDDPGIDHSRPIAVVTLGQARRIQWKEQIPGSHPQEQLLEHGSLFLMPAGFQQTHFHRIPRDPSVDGVRISLTYRGLI